MTKNILITSAGAGPAVAVIKALKAQKEIKLKVISVDMDSFAAGLYLSDNHYLVPFAKEPDFIDRILEICKKEDINIIIPIFDTETIVFANNIECFKSLDIKVLVNEAEVVRICNDKLITYKFCLENQILVPEVYTQEQLNNEQVEFPIVLKPRMGVGTKGIRRIENMQELSLNLPLKDDYLAQKYIEGIEYTIDSISDEKTEVLAVVPRERMVVKDGQTVKGRTTKDERLINYGREITRKFRIKWVGCSQCKITKDSKIFFIEMNPRYGTGVSLSIGAGVNIPLIQIKLALGIGIRQEELEFLDNFYMIRYWEEIFKKGDSFL